MKEEKGEKKGIVLMAFASGKESTDAIVFPKYIGIGTFNVIAVNPTKDEMEKIYKREFEKETDYTSIDEETKVPQVRLDFIVKAVEEKSNGIELITKQSFFLKKEMRFNKDKTKVQVINKYGETTWVTAEELKNQTVPANVTSWFEGPFRPVFVGEAELTEFLKTYMNIPGKSYKKKSGEIVYLENLADAEARLDNIETYFSGNVKEIKELVKLQPNNKVVIPVGVKTTTDNKQYQDLFSRMILRSSSVDSNGKLLAASAEKLATAIDSAKAAGAYASTEFSLEPLHEYAVVATQFANGTGGSIAAPTPPPTFGGFFGSAPSLPPAPKVEDDMPF